MAYFNAPEGMIEVCCETTLIKLDKMLEILRSETREMKNAYLYNR